MTHTITHQPANITMPALTEKSVAMMVLAVATFIIGLSTVAMRSVLRLLILTLR